MESSSALKGLAYGGIASCVAETITMPVDVVKTRLQMDGASGTRQYCSSIDCAKQMVAGEGPSALFKGLSPALVRQSTYGSLRYGLYGPIKSAIGIRPGEKVPLWRKVVAGGAAGAIASAVANPTDLLKVRLQTDGMLKDAEGEFVPKRFNSMSHAFVTIVREEGVAALWTGVGPTVGRATALAAAELATYDEVKTRLLDTGCFVPGLALTVTTAFVSGFALALDLALVLSLALAFTSTHHRSPAPRYVSIVASSPFDVIKSRLMGQPITADGKATSYMGFSLRQLFQDEP